MRSRKHYRLVGGFYDRDTPEALRERLAYRRAETLLATERQVRYPTITVENLDEALRWQAARLAELTKD